MATAAFPGWKRPGLIEAIIAEFINLRNPYFRGGNAPASLKLAWVGKGLKLTGLFPGWKRPGLIEAKFAKEEQQYDGVFPGWKRPGLIEAWS